MTTNLTSDEREQQLKEIRARRGRAMPQATHYINDVGFLLSLIDSEAGGSDRVKWDANHWMLNVFTNNEFTFAQKVGALVKYHNDAATSVRDLCISEILVMKAEHIARGDLPLGRKVFDEITKRLQSLTLDQVEQKRK